MHSSQIPDKFPIPFANNAGAGYIRTVPETHQPASLTDAPASLYDGFPPETFVPVASGGVPPAGADFNGILNQLSAWARWGAAGGPALFDADFSSAVGGYPKGATLISTVTPGVSWISLVDNNTTDPDSVGAANWQVFGSVGSFDAHGATFANGLSMRWGIFTASSGNTVVTFQTPFASVCYAVVASGSGNPGANQTNAPAVITGTISRNGFTVYNADSRVIGTAYIAVGA